MANKLYGNPIIMDNTTGATWSGIKYVKEVQWLDDAGDIANNDILIIAVNGVTITRKVLTATLLESGYQIFGPYDKGIPWQDVTVTIPHGALVIWVE